MHGALGWLWQTLAGGEGEVSEVRRFKRKPELALLVSDAEELRKLSPYAWRNMGCSGLRPQESPPPSHTHRLADRHPSPPGPEGAVPAGAGRVSSNPVPPHLTPCPPRPARPQEMRCLVHVLGRPGMPAHAEDFLKMLQVARVSRERVEMEAREGR